VQNHTLSLRGSNTGSVAPLALLLFPLPPLPLHPKRNIPVYYLAKARESVEACVTFKPAGPRDQDTCLVFGTVVSTSVTWSGACSCYARRSLRTRSRNKQTGVEQGQRTSYGRKWRAKTEYDYVDDTWADPPTLKVEEIGTAKDGVTGVQCASFNAG